MAEIALSPLYSALAPSQIVEDLPPSHSLVLNKFNTMRNHGLVITKDFRSQEEALSEAGK